MEIERKFLIDGIPEEIDLSHKVEFEQGYLCTAPVVRIRREGDDYFLTYKSGGMMVREEYNLPLDKKSYAHLREKIDDPPIIKTRYRIRMEEKNRDGSARVIELDQFHGSLEPLRMAEVEFPTMADADEFVPPEWFGREVTYDRRYHNSHLCKISYRELMKDDGNLEFAKKC